MVRKICLLHLTLVFVFISLAFTFGSVSAIPGIPHQFYGDVIVNGNPAPDNNVITAVVNGDEYLTVTKDGRYGITPNIFYVEDPDGDRDGDTIEFLLGGKPVGTYVFESNGYTKLDFSTTTTCGDGYCLGNETCASCSSDCGICTDPPVITVISPENKVYDTAKIDLKVSADQEILIWMYSLNGADPVTFTPDITITAQEGINEITVIGISKINYLSGTSTVSFTVELGEYCGDGNCDPGETCSSCPHDCGSCPPPPSGNGGNGGGGYTPPCEENWTCTEWSECVDGEQNKVCTDLNQCGTNESKPAETQECEVEAVEDEVECEADEKICDDNQILTCSTEGKFIVVETCEFGCFEGECMLEGFEIPEGTEGVTQPSNPIMDFFNTILGFFGGGEVTGAVTAEEQAEGSVWPLFGVMILIMVIIALIVFWKFR